LIDEKQLFDQADGELEIVKAAVEVVNENLESVVVEFT